MKKFIIELNIFVNNSKTKLIIVSLLIIVYLSYKKTHSILVTHSATSIAVTKQFIFYR